MAELILLFHLAMLHEVVGQAHAQDFRPISVVVHPFQYGRPHAAVAYAVLNGDDLLETFAHFLEQLLVERLEEAKVVVSHLGHLLDYGSRLFLSPL